jgi:hypothetical protein
MGEDQVKTSCVETQASDEWVQYFVLVRQEGEGESRHSAALEQVAALSALCGDWISPLAVSLRVESREPEDYYFADEAHPPARRFWFLRQREWDERVSLRPYWNNPEERLVEAIGPAELSAFVREALAQPPPMASLKLALPELSVTALGISLPEGVELEPRYNGRPIRPALIRDGHRSLVLGPTSGVAAAMPARLSMNDQYGAARISLELCWDLWREHPASRAQLRGALERVLSRGRGWQLERGELPQAG